MPVPIVVIGYFAAAGLAAVSTWIASLPQEEQEKIQKKANKLASQLFQKALERLTPPELKRIADQIKD